MKVFFRVDASARIGVGHLMRCLTLANALRARGVQICFVCCEDNGNLIALLQQKAIPVAAISALTIGYTNFDKDSAVWPDVTQVEDAKETVEALNGEKPDWLVVDHYGLGIKWEQQLRPHIGKLMVIDDLANRSHECDVLLDQNFPADGEHRYAGLVPDVCKLLVGPRYALLRPEYAAYRKTHHARDGKVRRVLVFFGGSDLQNMTGLALEALNRAELRHLEVDVVIGVNNPHRETLTKQVDARPKTKIYGLRPHLADLMAKADLAIGAGGTTTWERMCLGLPTVVISIAENQRSASEALAEARLIHYAGHFSDIEIDHFTQRLQQLSRDAERLAVLSEQNKLYVDGLGALRLVEFLHPSSSEETRLRLASEEDVVFYYNWANDPYVRENATNTASIPWATHQTWFKNKLNNHCSHLFVLEADSLPIGQIRFDVDAGEACIDYSLDTIVRGRGWGSRLITKGVSLMRKIESIPLRAEVKIENEISRSVFSGLGFTEMSSHLGAGYKSFYCGPVEGNNQSK